MSSKKKRLLDKFKIENSTNKLVRGNNLKNGKPYSHYVYEPEKNEKRKGS